MHSETQTEQAGRDGESSSPMGMDGPPPPPPMPHPAAYGYGAPPMGWWHPATAAASMPPPPWGAFPPGYGALPQAMPFGASHPLQGGAMGAVPEARVVGVLTSVLP